MMATEVERDILVRAVTMEGVGNGEASGAVAMGMEMILGELAGGAVPMMVLGGAAMMTKGLEPGGGDRVGPRQGGDCGGLSQDTRSRRSESRRRSVADGYHPSPRPGRTAKIQREIKQQTARSCSRH